jgi:hypothetical protein
VDTSEKNTILNQHKINTTKIQKDSFYIDAYTGSYRGVLVACQSDNEELQGTYGHFPLDLFC